ncbi:hypothetical protein ACTWP5_20565 [Streptomyces sp. 4N509B]|uniref:hypothetical protein n=1 Tax=Streptomyces sp. 4N509B TaxID=3457413 RepID=UPI003FD04732
MRTRRLGGAAVAVAVAASLAACGGGDEGGPGQLGGGSGQKPEAGGGEELAALPPEEMLQRAMDAVVNAGSGRVTYTVSGMATTEVDYARDSDGTCVGEVTNSEVGTVEFVARGEEVWAKPDERMWQDAGAGAGGAFHDSYVHGPADHPSLSGVANVCGDWEELVSVEEQESQTEETGARVEWLRGEDTAVLGQRAHTIRWEYRDGEDRIDATYLVAAEGEPYLLRTTMESTSELFGDTTGEFALSDFGEPVDATAPPADQTVEIEELGDVNPFASLG